MLKKVHNKIIGKEQHESYRKFLGENVPKNFRDFQNLKYEDAGEVERNQDAETKGRIISGTRNITISG